MATVTNGYVTLTELKNHIQANGGGGFTAADDDNLSIAINAASRWIDRQKHTSFYARDETRYFTAKYGDLLYVDDLLSVTTLKTDDNADGTYETTWATTDYVLEPRNAALGSEPQPYRQIRYNVNGDYSFPVNVRDGVQIVGSWGYASSAPAAIKQATLLMAHRLWKRKDAIFGVAGTAALGITMVQAKITTDTDIMTLLDSIGERGF